MALITSDRRGIGRVSRRDSSSAMMPISSRAAPPTATSMIEVLPHHRFDRTARHRDQQRADDGAVGHGDGQVAGEIADAVDGLLGLDRLVGHHGVEQRRAGHDRRIEQALAIGLEQARRADDEIGADFGVVDIDGGILAGDAGNGVDHVMGAEARHGAHGERCDIAGLVGGDLEAGQVDLQDLGGDAGGAGHLVLGIGAGRIGEADEQPQQHRADGDGDRTDGHGGNGEGEADIAEQRTHSVSPAAGVLLDAP